MFSQLRRCEEERGRVVYFLLFGDWDWRGEDRDDSGRKEERGMREFKYWVRRG